MDVAIAVFVVFLLIWVWNSVYTIRAGECGVVMRLGRMMDEVKPPGVQFVLWPTDTLYRVSLLEQSLQVAAREYLVDGTRTLRLAMKLNFRVVDAKKALTDVQDYRYALASLGEKTMEAVAREQADEKYLAGEGSLGEMVKTKMEAAATEWGIEVMKVEVSAG